MTCTSGVTAKSLMASIKFPVTISMMRDSMAILRARVWWLALIYINTAVTADVALVMDVNVDQRINARGASDLVVSGTFYSIPEAEPEDGIGIPTDFLRMRFIVEKSYKEMSRQVTA